MNDWTRIPVALIMGRFNVVAAHDAGLRSLVDHLAEMERRHGPIEFMLAW